MPEALRVPAGPKIRAWARQHGFSEWMVARWLKLTDTPERLLANISQRPPQYVRVNPLRCTPKKARMRLEARGFEVAPTDLDEHVLRIVYAPISAGATYEHLAGMTTPQDLASAAAPIALDARPGDVVADLAAAPGVKTLHLAGMMNNQGAIVAVEPHPDRARALRFNLERCGVTNTLVRESTAQDLPGEAWADKVLLDAPCTGEGTIPKDRKRRRGKPAEVERLSDLQEELLDAADRILKPNGVLVYATCTFAPEENELQVQRLIDRGYTVEELPFSACVEPLFSGTTVWGSRELDPSIANTKRFMPGTHPTLGFYVARLRKGAA